MTRIASEPLDRIFSALAHPIRRAVLTTLASGPRTVLELADPHPVSLNAVSRHLKVLESASLISREQDGNYHRMTLDGEALRPAHEWILHYAHFWGDNLASLKRHLERS